MIERSNIEGLAQGDIGRTVVIRCRLSSARRLPKLIFLNVRQRMDSIQVSCATRNGGPSPEMIKWIDSLPMESILLVEGTLRSMNRPKKIHTLTVQDMEIEAEKVRDRVLTLAFFEEFLKFVFLEDRCTSSHRPLQSSLSTSPMPPDRKVFQKSTHTTVCFLTTFSTDVYCIYVFVFMYSDLCSNYILLTAFFPVFRRRRIKPYLLYKPPSRTSSAHTFGGTNFFAFIRPNYKGQRPNPEPACSSSSISKVHPSHSSSPSTFLPCATVTHDFLVCIRRRLSRPEPAAS